MVVKNMAAGHVRAESGLQVLARLGNRPTICDIELSLFPPNVLKSKDMIELRGASGSGKTLMLTHLIAKCILSREFGGQGARAILINTDHHFQLTRLVGMLEHFLKTGGCKAIQKELKTSLGMLEILACYNSLQLSVTLNALPQTISGRQEVALLAFDGPAAYYWADAHIDSNEMKICSKQAYFKSILQMVLSPGVYQQSVVFIYTVSDAFVPPKFVPVIPLGVNYCKVFLKMHNKNLDATSSCQTSSMGIYFSASMSTHQSHNSHNANFVIKSSGIHWMQ